MVSLHLDSPQVAPLVEVALVEVVLMEVALVEVPQLHLHHQEGV